jgi:hypothetical protein
VNATRAGKHDQPFEKAAWPPSLYRMVHAGRYGGYAPHAVEERALRQRDEEGFTLIS